MNKYNDYIAECIKEAGQMLIDNCEDFAGKTDGMTDFHITIWFPQDSGCPEVEVTRTHIPEFKTLNRLIDIKDRLYTKEDSSIVK